MNTNQFETGTTIHPRDPKCFLYTDASHYGWGAHLEPTRLSFHGHWTEDQSQLHINMLQMMAIRLALKQAITFIHHSWIMISTDNTMVVSYINKQGGTHSPNLCVEVWKILNWCLEHDIVIRVCHIPGKFNILADRLSRFGKPIKTQWALGQTVANSVFQMLNFPNVDLFATRFNHKLPLYVSPVQDNKTLAIDALSMDWNHLHAYAFPPFILIPAVLEKIRQHQCRIVLTAPFWSQQQWFSELLLLLVSALICLPLIPGFLTQSKGRFVHQNLPLLNHHVWELSNNQSEIKKISQNVADFVSRSRRTSTQKVYNAKWTIFSNWCHTKKVNPISAPITVIADFLIFLFSEKKCQISTIKGYRAMISNTLRFKTGNRI